MKAAAIINNILKADANVTAAVSTRIFPVIAPQGTQTPFIVHIQTDNQPHGSKTSPSTWDAAHVEIFVVHENMDTVEDIAETVRLALDRYTGTVSGIEVNSVEYLDENPNFDMESGRFLKRLLFKIMAKR